MADKNTHPSYPDMDTLWELCLDSYSGEYAIKGKTTIYLPATSGMNADGMSTGTGEGKEAYDSYLKRAVYPEIYKEAVQVAVGMMHKEPPVIDLPTSLEPMRERATPLDETLVSLLRKINMHQLITGRLGIMGDLQKINNKVTLPTIIVYNERSILNWHEVTLEGGPVLHMVLLDETNYNMTDDFNWVLKEQQRVLALTDSEGTIFPPDTDTLAGAVYSSAALEAEDTIAAADFESPIYRGQVSEAIPFVFINSSDLATDPDIPPLLDVANLCLTIYRGEADYRQNLFMQGQDTLVRIGVLGDDADTLRVGAGSRIDLPINGDAKYIGVDSLGLPEQRTSLENDYNRAMQKSGRLLDSGGGQESGEALKVRVAARTATLPQIAQTGAMALEKLLKIMATWVGANPDEVKVTPNLEFAENAINSQTLVQIIQSKTLGAPLSDESIHDWMREQGFTEKTYEEELAAMAVEEPDLGDGLSNGLDDDDNGSPDGDVSGN